MFFAETYKRIFKIISAAAVAVLLFAVLFTPMNALAENENPADADTTLTESPENITELTDTEQPTENTVTEYTFSTVNTTSSSQGSDSITMRVKLSIGSVSSVTFTVSGSYTLTENNSVLTGGTYTVTASGSTVSITGNGIGYSGSAITLTRNTNDSSITQNRVYNSSTTSCVYLGNMTYSASDSKITVINHIDLEKYLYGVVSNEMSNSWPLEALKAQAVCARSYAVKSISATKPYDLTDTSTDQVYYGYNPSYKNVISAVDGTAGVVAKYNNKIITAFYSASNGGQTELPGNAWGGSKNADFPYLVQKDDKYDLENSASSVQITNVPSDPSGLLSQKTVKIVNCNTSCNVRNKPTTSGSQVIGQAPKNSTYILVNVTGDWYEVLYNMPDGSTVNAFINYEFIEVVNAESGLYVYANPAISDIQAQAYKYCKNTLKFSIYNDSATSIRIDKINSLKNGTERWPGTGSRSYVTAIANVTASCFKDANGTLSGQKTFDVSIVLMNTGSSGYIIAHDYLASNLRLRGIEAAANGWNIVCRRFGHGVGMSQRGAQTMANKYSLKYTDIIAFYFPGTVLTAGNSSGSGDSDFNGNIITGIAELTDVAKFISDISAQKGDCTISLTDASGNAKTSGTVCTGDIIVLTDSSGKTEKHTAVIYGDVNCDGTINLSDLLAVQKAILGAKQLEGSQVVSADISKDSNVNVLDLLKLQKHLLGSSLIIQ
ncbi:MAG: SpoIID/LytB domain-containing protein [Christensenellaceae bacterium]|nr:SpoIID/LytB domain-containing protein [Christensenellaceae bacterium]